MKLIGIAMSIFLSSPGLASSHLPFEKFCDEWIKVAGNKNSEFFYYRDSSTKISIRCTDKEKIVDVQWSGYKRMLQDPVQNRYDFNSCSATLSFSENRLGMYQEVNSHFWNGNIDKSYSYQLIQQGEMSVPQIISSNNQSFEAVFKGKGHEEIDNRWTLEKASEEKEIAINIQVERNNKGFVIAFDSPGWKINCNWLYKTEGAICNEDLGNLPLSRRVPLCYPRF